MSALGVAAAPTLRRSEGGTAALLKRGVLAGLGGGVVMAGLLLAVGEPSIRRALALEAAQHHGEKGEEMFSRGVQTFGGVTAALLYGALVGVIFTVAYLAVARRARVGAFRLSIGLAGVGFVAAVVVPALKYPANPPGVGDPATVGERTAAYLTLLGASVLLAVLAWQAWLALRDRAVPEEGRAAAVGVLWLAGVVLACVAWPTTPDPVTVPAQLLWRFRLQSLGGAFLAWMTMAHLFGWLMSKAVGIQHDTDPG